MFPRHAFHPDDESNHTVGGAYIGCMHIGCNIASFTPSSFNTIALAARLKYGEVAAVARLKAGDSLLWVKLRLKAWIGRLEQPDPVHTSSGISSYAARTLAGQLRRG